MATYTQYYNLDKYEGTDRPNLRDQYNAAMDKIDNQLHTQDGNISSQATAIQTLQQTQAVHTGQITALQADVATAQATATSASTAATNAQADATNALGKLAGNSIEIITPQNYAQYLTIPSDSIINTNKDLQISGILIKDDNGGASIVLTVCGNTNAITTSMYDHSHALVTLRDYVNAGAGVIVPCGFTDHFFQKASLNANSGALRWWLYLGVPNYDGPAQANGFSFGFTIQARLAHV